MKRVTLTVSRMLKDYLAQNERAEQQGLSNLMAAYAACVQLFLLDSAGCTVAASALRASHSREFTSPDVRSLLGVDVRRNLLRDVHKGAARLTGQLTIVQQDSNITLQLRLEYWMAARLPAPICRVVFTAAPSGETLSVVANLL